MKRILTLLVFVLSAISFAYAQPACTVKYQAVARDANDNIYPTRALGVQVKIRSGGADGAEVYIESHGPTTTTLGLFNIEVGAGAPEQGSWEDIDWSATTYYMEVLMDLDGGTNYKSVGVSPILAVPIAMWAKNSEPQNLEFIPDSDECGTIGKLAISGVPDEIILHDLDASNELQTLRYDQQLNKLILSDPNGKKTDTVGIPGGGSIPDPLTVKKLNAETICVTDEEEEDSQVLIEGTRVRTLDATCNYNIELTHQDGRSVGGEAGVLSINSSYEPENSVIEFGSYFAGNTPESYEEAAIRRWAAYDLEGEVKIPPLKTELFRPRRFEESQIYPSLGGADTCLKTVALENSFQLERRWPQNTFSEPAQSNTIGLIGPDVFRQQRTLGNQTELAISNVIDNTGGNAFEYIQRSHRIGNLLAQNDILDENGFRSLGRNQANDICTEIHWSTGQFIGTEFMVKSGLNGGVHEMAVMASSEPVATHYGTGTLVNGEVFIELPQPFCQVVNLESMRVNVTPLSADTYGLAVIEKTSTGFRVKEVAGGTGNFSFDWEVNCTRLVPEENLIENPDMITDLDEYLQKKGISVSDND